MKQIEVKAKSVHEAIEEAAEKLGVSQDELQVEVVSQGGMFGKAKILASVKPDVAKPKAEPAPEPKPIPQPEKKADAPPVKKSAAAKSTSGTDKPDAASAKAVVREKSDAGVKKEPPAKKDADAPKKVVSKKVVPGGKFAATVAFVTKLLELLESGSDIETVEAEDAYNINVTNGQIGRLIGKGGVTMNAIQTLVTSIGISNSNGDPKRVYINIGDYREKRGDSLQSLAQKKADYVKRTGRFVKLEPMNAKDRAILHTALAGVEGIKTYSTGKDPFRCLCIAPADEDRKGDSSSD